MSHQASPAPILARLGKPVLGTHYLHSSKWYSQPGECERAWLSDREPDGIRVETFLPVARRLS